MIIYLMLFQQAIPEGKDKILKIPKLLDNGLFPVLVNRTVLFFLAMCFINLFLYIIGTVQGFMDSIQLLLLRIAVVSSVLLTLSAFYGFALDLLLFFRGKKMRFILGLWGYAFSGLFGCAMAALAVFIITVSEGNIR
jgi:hypothetical protein